MGSGKKWSELEEKRLKNAWHTVRTSSLQRMLPGRSRVAILEKAKRMKLPTGAPQGTVTLEECAQMMGVDWRLLKKILNECGVPIRHWSDRFMYVDAFDAEEAVKRWDNDMETLWDASQRMHVHVDTLQRALTEAGVAFERGRKYLKTDIAKWWEVGQRESLRAAAKRLGVDRRTLAAALRLDSAEETRGPKARIKPANADRALARYRDPARRQTRAKRTRTSAA